MRMPTSVSFSKGIKFAPLARAVGDAARLMLQRDHVQSVVCAAVQKGKCPPEDLIAELRAGPAAGSALFRAALAGLVAGIRSEAEQDLKYRIERSGLDQPMYNANLYLPDGTFLGTVDEWWQRAGVALEVDSLQYHFKAADYLMTTRRHNRIEAAGVNLLHFLPMDIKQDWLQIRTTIRDAIASGLRRPPLPIIAVPQDVRDHKAYLLTRLP
jgi:hypothetical protein